VLSRRGHLTGADATMRIVRSATVPFFLLHHLRGQINAMVAAGHEVILVSSPTEGADRLARWPGISFQPIDIPRPIALWRDLVSLWRMYQFLRRVRPDIVHSTTPKAGIIHALAAWLARVPIRLHTFTGQAWAERQGMVRRIGKLADRLIIALNTRTYADSRSQCAYLAEEGVAPLGCVRVLGNGSLGGVDLAALDPAQLASAGNAVRARLGIPAGARVIVFIGRVTRDKGVAELVEAFGRLQSEMADAHLILVGPFEPDLDPLPAATLNRIRDDPRIAAVGYDADAAKYLAAADVLCLASYREGFPNVVIEAAAMGVPTVGTDIVGLCDAIVDGVTGVLVPPRDAAALAYTLIAVLTDDDRRRSLGQAARERAHSLFDARVVNGLLLREYAELAGRRR
jgi:glycosyltransferase involved in cell wall biosynthesis